MEIVYYYDTEAGRIGIAERNGAVSRLFTTMRKSPQKAEERETPLIRRTVDALREYLAGKRTSFDDLPLAPQGTEFQQAVWRALLEIPYGETRTYKDIAIRVGCPKGFRAVGLANNRNPIAIIIPCHRVLGSDGSLTGYGGGLPLKKRLLAMEGVSAFAPSPQKQFLINPYPVRG